MRIDLSLQLMKYNLEGCRQMDTILNTEAKLKKAMLLINENLVDSNMFIRAMVLAADHFINKTGNLAFALNSRLLTFFRGMDKHIGLIERLTKIVNVNSLTQENISCLNTALVKICPFQFHFSTHHIMAD
jgi:Trpc4-associated protein